MKEIFKLGGLLMLITTIAATALAGIYSVAKPRIEAQKEKIVENALEAALPNTGKQAIQPAHENNSFDYYRAFISPERKEVKGYAYIASGQGYSSIIETMIGVDTSGTILGITVLSQQETPGLGTRIQAVKYGETEPWFPKQFLGKKAGKVAIEQDGGDIQAITGATISSRAMTNSIVEGYEKLKEKINKK